VFVHGVFIAGDAFKTLVEQPVLADRYRLITYDRRGYGGSAAAPKPFALRKNGDDLERLLDGLGVDRAHVVGHSSGAMVAIQLAIQAPDRVQSLGLLELAPNITPEMSAFVEAHVLPGLRTLLDSGAPAREVLDSFLNLALSDKWREEMPDVFDDAIQQAEADIVTGVEIELPSQTDWNFDEQMAAKIVHPVLFVGGETTIPDLRDPPRHHFCGLVAQSEYVELPGIDHRMMMSDPGAVANVLADFFGRHAMA